MGEDTGRISEWNEGQFKSARLNTIQESINLLWLNPTTFYDGKFNYEWLFSQLKILEGEGHSKYSTKEREKTDTLRLLLEEALEIVPPARTISNHGLSSKGRNYIVDGNRLKMFLELLRKYERTIKDYNDKHGLTTSNREDEDDWS